MKEKSTARCDRRTICNLDRQFKEKFGTIFSNQVKKMKICKVMLTKQREKLQIKQETRWHRKS